MSRRFRFGVFVALEILLAAGSVRAQSPAVVKGTVFACATHMKLANIAISVISPHDKYATVSDSNGRFLLVGLVAGQYTIAATDPMRTFSPQVVFLRVANGDIGIADIGLIEYLRALHGHCSPPVRIQAHTVDRYDAI
jgi:hypothetical protein